MLKQHSQRTVRKGCNNCGDTSLYWAHDTERDGGFWCDDHQTNGKLVLINKDGTRHLCIGNNTPKITNTTPKKEVQVTETVTTPQVAPDAFAAFQALMSSIAPSVNRDEIDAMIKTHVDAIVHPTRTVVERVNGDVKEIASAHHKLADVTMDLLAGEHVLMVGPAGTGKSTIAENAAESLGLEFYAISLSPMTPASQILGYMQAEGEYVRTLYREAYENGGVFHFDEFDNAHPSVLAVINASLANGKMAFPDKMVKRHEDFRCVASANTYGLGPDRQYVGRQQIDAATLDRFAIETIEVDEALEDVLCGNTGVTVAEKERVLKYVRKLRKAATKQGMTVVMSPRASIGMCRLIQAGKSWESAVESRVRRGMSDKDWTKLTTEF